MLVVGLFLVALCFLGLVFDMARAFAERSALQARADEAVLAATSAVEDEGLGAGQVRLGPDDAPRRARALLARVGLDPSTQVVVGVEADQVEVRLRRRVPTTFLRLVGLRTMDIGARATGRARPPRP